MDRSEFQEILRKRPFEAIEVGLTDGRSVLVRHPDQVILTRRNAIFGLSHVKNGRKRLRSPDNGERYVKDWLMIDLLHVVSAEPANDRRRPPKKRGRPRA
ncbi:MAG: hypothetical protein AAB363_05210, partial [Planctomycetota bacterium]|jgi:hypothetical protein